MRDQTISSETILSENEVEYVTTEYPQPSEGDAVPKFSEGSPSKPPRSRMLPILSWFLVLVCTGYAGCRYYVGDPIRLFRQCHIGQQMVAWNPSWNPFRKTNHEADSLTILTSDPKPDGSESKTLAEITPHSTQLATLPSCVTPASADAPAKPSQRVAVSRIGNEIPNSSVVPTAFQSTVFHTPDPNGSVSQGEGKSLELAGNPSNASTADTTSSNEVSQNTLADGMPERFPQTLTPNPEPCALENLDTTSGSDLAVQRDGSFTSPQSSDAARTGETSVAESATDSGTDASSGTRPEENDPNIRIVLMERGRFFRGYVTEEATRYLVEELSGSELVLPKERVLAVCRTIREAYEYQKSHEIPTADEILRLTGWCIQEKLWEEAEAELAIAEDVAADHPQLPLIRQRLAVAKQLALSPPEALKSTIRVTAGGPSAEVLAKMMAAMPPESASIFVRDIQPMLLNTCTTSGCHLREEEGRFVLSKPSAGIRPTQRQTERNLYAVLQWIDRDSPLESPLLTVAVRPHGTQRTAPFHNRPERSYWTLVAWSCMVCGMESPHAEESEGLDSPNSPQYADGVMPAGFTVASDMLNANQGRVKPELKDRPKISPLGVVMPTAVDRRSATLTRDDELERSAAELEALNASNPQLVPGESTNDVWSSVAQASAAQTASGNVAERMDTVNRATSAVAVTGETSDSAQTVQWTTGEMPASDVRNGNTAEKISNTPESSPSTSQQSARTLDPFDPTAFNAAANQTAANETFERASNAGTQLAAQVVPEAVVTTAGKLSSDGPIPKELRGDEDANAPQTNVPQPVVTPSQPSNLVSGLANQPAAISPLALMSSQASGTPGDAQSMGVIGTRTNSSVTTSPLKRRTLRSYREVMGDL